MYTEAEARELVIKAGLKLLEAKLIARTWGNISARISDTQFVITPSGREYDSLKPEELVIVNIGDCSYEGDIKPSSEKGIHAEAYRQRADVNFIIHTHQHYASAICAEEKDTEFAPCAKYGLPGRPQLRENVALTLAIHPEFKAFLLAKHGTLCLGTSYEDAFDTVNDLEKKCRELFVKESRKCDNRKYAKPWLDDYAQIVGMNNPEDIKEDPEAVAIITAKNRAAAEYVRDAKPLGIADAGLQRAFYLLKYSKMKNKNK